MQSSPISLATLCNLIKDKITEQFWESVWIVAEISEIRYNANGHCYLELIEKDEKSDQIIAKIKANIWAYSFKMIRPYFEKTTGQPLSSGIKVLVQCKVEFQEVFGLSLNIKNIDPTYTLGDLAKRRNEILNQLRLDGVIDMNKEVERPTVIQRIAIISSPTAAGYEDFVNQINANTYGFVFYHKLFPAIMQGEQAESSIIQALENVYANEQLFDAVALIRGGGSTADLMCFDSYQLALNIAQFPLPVFTGIGHERDLSIADMVAHQHLKTPTAVAEFFIAHNLHFLVELNQHLETMADIFRDRIAVEKDTILSMASDMTNLSTQLIGRNGQVLSLYSNKIINTSRSICKSNRHQLRQFAELLSVKATQPIKADLLKLKYIKKNLQLEVYQVVKTQHSMLNGYDKQNHLFNPMTILNKGYSITYLNNKILMKSDEVKTGDVLTTKLNSGLITSRVEVVSKAEKGDN